MHPVIMPRFTGMGSEELWPGDGVLFAGEDRLYSAAPDGLEVWDPRTGERTGTIPGFVPASHHADAGELAGISGGVLRRWAIPRAPLGAGSTAKHCQ